MLTKKQFKALRIKLLRLDVTMSQIARDFHTSRQMVHQSLRGEHNSTLADSIRRHVRELAND